MKLIVLKINLSKFILISVLILILLVSIARIHGFVGGSNSTIEIEEIENDRKEIDISSKREIALSSLSRLPTQQQDYLISKKIDFSSDIHPISSLVITDVPETISELKVIGFNDDLVPDIIASSSSTVYFLNVTTREIIYTSETFNMINSLVIGDWNYDDTPDVAIGTSMEGVYFIDGSSGNTLFNNTNLANVTALTVGDWNADNVSDIAVGLDNSSVFFLNGVNGSVLYNNDTSGFVHTLAAADFNNDSTLDVVAGTADGIVILNGTNGQEISKIDGLGAIHTLVVEDFNNDSIPDVAAGGINGVVHFINGSTGTILFSSSDLGFMINTLAVGEWTNDSTPDLIVGGINETIYFLNGSTGSTIDTSTASAIISSLSLCDWNNDSTLDLVTGTVKGEISFIDGITRKIFHTSLTIGEVGVIKAVDLNNDSVHDIIATGIKNVHIIFSDLVAPILNYALLPEVTTSEEILEFQVIFDEPNIKNILMKYIDETNKTISLFPTKYERTSVTFTIPYFENPILNFWYWANDTWGNVKAEGNETNTFSLPVLQRNIMSNYEQSRDKIHSLVVADFNNDTIPDIAAAVSSGNPSIFFINGATGETQANFSEVLATDEVITKIAEIEWNNGSLPDIVACTSKGYLFIIDSTTGDAIHKLHASTMSINSLTIIDFTQDSIPDIVVGSYGQIHFIDGVTGDMLFTSDIRAGVVEFLTTGILNGDNVPDFVTTSYEESTKRSPGDSMIHFINGATKAELYNYTLSNQEITTLAVSDCNNDFVSDVVVGTSLGDIDIIDGSTGLLYRSIGLTEQIDAIGLYDWNNDAIPEIAVATVANRIFIFDGATGNEIFNAIIFDNIVISDENTKIVIEDLTKDSIPDIVLTKQGWQGIYYIDGFTGEINSIKYDESITSNIILEDFDQNGVVDIVLGDQNGRVFAIQNLILAYTLFSSLESPTTISQGDQVDISVNLFNFYNSPITNAQVNLIAQKTGTNLFYTIGGLDLGNGTYHYAFTTENWIIGEWDLFSTISYSPYESIDLHDYQDWNGNYLPQKQMVVIGEAIPTVTASAEGASYSPGAGILEDVIESSIITLDVKVHDNYAHTLNQDEVNVTVQFIGKNYTVIALDEGDKFGVSLPTKDLKHGTYEMEILLKGSFLESSSHKIEVMIIPQFPSITISTDNLYVIAISTFIFTLILSKGLRMTYARLRSNPERAGWVLNMLMLISSLALVIVLASWYYLLTTTPIWSFMVLLLAIALVLTIFALFFFKIVHSQIISMQFSRRKFYGALIFVLLIAFLLIMVFIIAGEIQWFDYYVVHSQRNLYIFTIPQIYYDIGIIAFTLGFLLIVISTILRTRSNIKHLQEIKQQVREGYYPKHKNYLDSKKGDLLRDHFFLLTRSFVFWYGLIIVTFIFSFEIYEYVPLFAVVLIPAVLAFLIMFRGFIIDVVLDLLWYA